jgi:hypothetical protein
VPSVKMRNDSPGLLGSVGLEGRARRFDQSATVQPGASCGPPIKSPAGEGMYSRWASSPRTSSDLPRDYSTAGSALTMEGQPPAGG